MYVLDYGGCLVDEFGECATSPNFGVSGACAKALEPSETVEKVRGTDLCDG